MDQLGLIDIYRTFNFKAMNFTFFSSAHRTFPRRDHILGQEKKRNHLKPLSDHSVVRLDVNYRGKNIKNTNIGRLNNMLLNNQQIISSVQFSCSVVSDSL